MKTKFLFLTGVIMLTLSSCGGGELSIGSRTKVEYQAVYDVGTLTKGELAKVKIELKNVGDVPLVVGDVEAGCSCTTTGKPEGPIKPGDTGIVEASVNTDKIGLGKFSRDVRIVANSTPSTLVVSIQGNIVQ
jgi:hypothetical protein